METGHIQQTEAYRPRAFKTSLEEWKQWSRAVEDAWAWGF